MLPQILFKTAIIVLVIMLLFWLIPPHMQVIWIFLTLFILGSIINFQFVWFDIYDTIYCDSDRVRIYDGRDSSATLIAHICGGAASFQTSTKFHSDFGQVYALNSLFTSSGQYLFIEMITVSKTVTTGFNAKYTVCM